MLDRKALPSKKDVDTGRKMAKYVRAKHVRNHTGVWQISDSNRR